ELNSVELLSMAPLHPIHGDAVSKNAKDECDDAALLSEPESQREAAERKTKLIEPVGKQHAASEGYGGPNAEQDGHNPKVAAPIAIERGTDLRVALVELR